MKRVDKRNYYLNIAEAVLERSTCLRRKYGAVIVNNDEIISTGYNGSPRGAVNCNEKGTCIREELKVPRGTKYELCAGVHAEQNALLSASRRETIGASLYLVGKDSSDGTYISNAEPCSLCKKLIINSGIESIYIRDNGEEYRVIRVQEWLDNEDTILFGY
ncbi:MAG TPA: deaminase [Halanaerobiales bacterium]|nr:deaminase [Halanaerobiales bacterium]HQD04039.1 deaminase [Halanaerobiales bacterium]